MPNDYVFFFTPEELEFVLKYVNNGTAGVIYFIDEIHNYFNSLDSKNIPIWVFGEISQQRKQRKLIVATSQLFMRVAKPLREQCDNIIACSNLLTYLMIETIYVGWDISTDSDGNITSAKKGRKYFFQTRELRNKYDTFQKIMKSDYKPFAGSMFDFEEMKFPARSCTSPMVRLILVPESPGVLRRTILPSFRNCADSITPPWIT